MHIDWWTLALQTVNVVVLIWILGRFFFRPVVNLVAKRREATGKLLADADAARKEAADLRSEASKLRADIDAERDRLLAEAHKAAQAEKNTLLAQSSKEVQQVRTEAMAAVDRERTAAQRAILDHASELSVDIARRLLERLPQGVAFSAFLEGIKGELGKLPPEARNSLLVADADHPLEVATAAALSEQQAANLRQVLGATLGAELPLHLSSDPNLIAGFEFRGRNVIVRNNWQADLAQIRQELDRDKHG